MTVDELRALTDQEFDYIVMAIDGTIMFGIPIPGHPELECDIDRDGHVSRMTHADENLDAWEDAWEEYISKLLAASPEKRHNRTRRQAETAGVIVRVPKELAIITRAPYQDAISTRDNPVAHLQPIIAEQANRLHFDGGKLYFNGMDAIAIDLEEYYDKTHSAVSDLDIPTLQVLFSVILQDLASMLKGPETMMDIAKDPQFQFHGVRIYLPDLMLKMGYSANSSRDMQSRVIDKIKGFQSIFGIMKDHSSGRGCPSQYPVMLFCGYNSEENTVSFTSPYFNMLIIAIREASIQKNRHGKSKLSNTGEPFTLPSYSYLVKSGIAKERNKRAVAIVEIIVTLIEQTGNHTPHISVQTMPDLYSLRNRFRKRRNRDLTESPMRLSTFRLAVLTVTWPITKPLRSA